MKYRLAILSLLIFIAACEPLPSSGNDPFADSARADATRISAAARIDATSAARGDLIFQATLEAAKTQDASAAEMALIAAQTTSTQAAYAGQMTATNAAITADAQATREALGSSATESALQLAAAVNAAHAQATLQAMVVLQDAERVSLERDKIMNTIWQITLWGIVVLIILTICYVIWTWVRASRGRWSAFYRDARGDSPLLMIDSRIVNPDLSLWSSLDPLNEVTPEDIQVRIKDGSQKLAAIKALQTGRFQDTQMLSGSYRMVGFDNRPPENLLPPDVDTILEADWENADHE